jgi:hypothetical protein
MEMNVKDMIMLHQKNYNLFLLKLLLLKFHIKHDYPFNINMRGGIMHGGGLGFGTVSPKELHFIFIKITYIKISYKSTQCKNNNISKLFNGFHTINKIL